MPYEIMEKKELGTSGLLFEMVIKAPLIAQKAYAGNLYYYGLMKLENDFH